MDKNKLKCANCGNHGHPANYRRCPYYKHANSLITEKQDLREKTIIHESNKIIRASQRVEPGTSYADKAKNSRTIINTIQKPYHITTRAEETPQQATTTIWANNHKNEMIEMMAALQNANKLLNEKIENNYHQIKNLIEDNTEKIYRKIEENAAMLEKKINSNVNRIDAILANLMGTEYA